MPDVAKVIDGKKFMWDGEVYESEKDAQEVKQKYEKDDFEVELIHRMALRSSALYFAMGAAGWRGSPSAGPCRVIATP